MSRRPADRPTLEAIDVLLDRVGEHAARRIADSTFAPVTLRLFERRVLDRLIVDLLGQRVEMTAIVERLMVRGVSRSSAYVYIGEAQSLRCPETPLSPGRRAVTMSPCHTPSGATP